MVHGDVAHIGWGYVIQRGDGWASVTIVGDELAIGQDHLEEFVVVNFTVTRRIRESKDVFDVGFGQELAHKLGRGGNLLMLMQHGKFSFESGT